MARTNKNDYFLMMTEQMGLCTEASALLENALCNYSYHSISAMQKEMHALEQKADDLYHETVAKLSAEFITPIDQEDILHLVQLIDDIMDALDEVLLEFYMYDVSVLPVGADNLAKLVNRCVNALLVVVQELKNFKKPEKLRPLLVEVDNVEGEADVVYTEAIHHLFSQNTDAKTLISNNSIYESLENCCDLCEHAADIIQQIIIKNT